MSEGKHNVGVEAIETKEDRNRSKERDRWKEREGERKREIDKWLEKLKRREKVSMNTCGID